MIAAAVRNGAVQLSERLKLRRPGAVVAQRAVNKNQRVAGAALNVVQHHAVDGNGFRLYLFRPQFNVVTLSCLLYYIMCGSFTIFDENQK